MLKWVLLVVGLTIATIFVITIIKVMLKAEKDSKKNVTEDIVDKPEEYKPEEGHIDIHSASSGVPVTDMSNKDKSAEIDFVNDVLDDVPDLPMPTSGFMDDADDDFADFSRYARGGKGRRRPPIDFDLDGDMADEYIPDSPDFSYLPRHQQNRQKNKPISTALNELPTELKVLMLSDIFDRKFFD